jgi:hypothetical protein
VRDEVRRWSENCERVLEVLRVPENDGGDQQIEVGRPEKLVFESAVAQLAEAVEEDGARSAKLRSFSCVMNTFVL